MLIDDKYFVAGRTEVAGINIKSGGEKNRQALDAQNSINEWITDKEPAYLRAMLGNELYIRIFSDCDEEHTEHRRGHGGHDNDRERLFERIRGILVDEETRRSPIAYYVYFFYERNRVSFTTVAGERIKRTENSTAVSPMFKLVSLWNDMVDWNFRIVEALERAQIPIHPDFDDDIFHYINAFNI